MPKHATFLQTTTSLLTHLLGHITRAFQISKKGSIYSTNNNADVNNSSFDFTQVQLDLPDVQEVKDKHTDASETDVKCKKCDY